MAKTNLTLDTLGDLSDGRARVVIDAALKAAFRDVADRGHDGKSRKVVITVEMSKDETGELVATDVQAIPKLPPYRTPATMAKIGVEHGEDTLVFQTENRDRPDQETFPFANAGTTNPIPEEKEAS